MAIREFAQSKDGFKLRYEVRGSGAPVALIMGFSGSGRAWSERFLNLLEKHFRLVVIDNRGTGESDKPDVAWTLRDMADDIAAVLDHAKIPHTHVFGISMGGMIAQEYALTYPDRVQRLVLGCTNCGMSHSIPGKPEDIARLMPQPGMSPADAARAAFSVACGKAFTASEEGQKASAERPPAAPPAPAKQEEVVTGRVLDADGSAECLDQLLLPGRLGPPDPDGGRGRVHADLPGNPLSQRGRSSTEAWEANSGDGL